MLHSGLRTMRGCRSCFFLQQKWKRRRKKQRRKRKKQRRRKSIRISPRPLIAPRSSSPCSTRPPKVFLIFDLRWWSLISVAAMPSLNHAAQPLGSMDDPPRPCRDREWPIPSRDWQWADRGKLVDIVAHSYRILEYSDHFCIIDLQWTEARTLQFGWRYGRQAQPLPEVRLLTYLIFDLWWPNCSNGAAIDEEDDDEEDLDGRMIIDLFLDYWLIVRLLIHSLIIDWTSPQCHIHSYHCSHVLPRHAHFPVVINSFLKTIESFTNFITKSPTAKGKERTNTKKTG